MYIAMNRFQIVAGREKIFEQLWENRETYLESVKGFKSFNLIKGEANETFTLYASHSTWSSKMHSLIGLNLKHLEKHIKMQEVIEIFILAIQNLRDLK